jgi:molybdenum cofactor biosynthesis protein B
MRALVLTISDSRSAGDKPDQSGPAAHEILKSLGVSEVESRIIPDELERIRDAVRSAATGASLVVTTGGTGVGPRDVTPEAIGPLFDRELPGFGEIMRTGSFGKTPLSIISRGGAGIVGRCLVVMLPGSPGGVKDGLSLLGPAIRHVLKILADTPEDCEQARRTAE